MSEELLQSLRERFRESATERFAEMRSFIAVLEWSADDEEVLQSLSRHFHALAGMGGTYGFGRISTLGDEGEVEMMALIAGRRRPGVTEINRWREIIDAMEQELREGV